MLRAQNVNTRYDRSNLMLVQELCVAVGAEVNDIHLWVSNVELITVTAMCEFLPPRG
jgi:hypothetical protein